MKKNYLLLFLAVVTPFYIFANKNDKVPLFSIDNDTTYLNEFVYVYQKNNIDGSADFSKQSLEDYLQLFINYKLKVQEAKDKGLDTISSLTNEYNGYKRQLLENHIQRQILDPLVKQEYDRQQYDISVSHIYVDKNTDDAKSRITNIYNKLLSGANFETLAKDFSEDKQSAENGGYMGYFTALQIGFPQIEDVIYNTEKGKYSDIVETDIGFHIIRVNDIRPAYGTIKVAMIKLTYRDEEESKLAEKRIDSIYIQVKAGADFGQLAMQYSDDKNSAMKGGELEWFGINTYVPKFEEVAFNLEGNGDVSSPFKTNAAWYIIKRIDKIKRESFEKSESVLKAKLSHSRIFEEASKKFNDELEGSANFTQNEAHITEYLNSLDTLVNRSAFDYDRHESAYPVVSIAGQEITQLQLSEIIAALYPSVININGRQKSVKLLNMAIHELLLNHYEQSLVDSLFAYRYLLEEYKNGVLIFELTKENLWDKVAKDSIGLQKFYNSLGDQYMWNKRAELIHIRSKDGLVFKKLSKLIKKNKLYTAEKWNAFLDTHQDLQISVESETIEQEVTEGWDKIDWEKGLHKESDNVYYLVVDILPSQKKDLAQVRGFVISAYQKELEQRWLEDLHSRYIIKINQDALKSIEKKSN